MNERFFCVLIPVCIQTMSVLEKMLSIFLAKGNVTFAYTIAYIVGHHPPRFSRLCFKF